MLEIALSGEAGYTPGDKEVGGETLWVCESQENVGILSGYEPGILTDEAPFPHSFCMLPTS